MFSGITAGDSSLNGVIMAHEKVHLYQCCGRCMRSQFETVNKTCKFCGEAYTDPSQFHDYHVTILVGSDTNEEIYSVLVFRSIMGFEFNAMTESSLQKALEKKHMKTCHVEYDKDEAKKGMIKALAFVVFQVPDSGIMDSSQ